MATADMDRERGVDGRLGRTLSRAGIGGAVGGGPSTVGPASGSGAGNLAEAMRTDVSGRDADIEKHHSDVTDEDGHDDASDEVADKHRTMGNVQQGDELPRRKSSTKLGNALIHSVARRSSSNCGLRVSRQGNKM